MGMGIERKTPAVVHWHLALCALALTATITASAAEPGDLAEGGASEDSPTLIAQLAPPGGEKQTLPASPQSPGNSVSTGSALEEITVTATRREESTEKIPISIVALSQADLTQGGIKSIADLAAVTPGLQFGSPNPFSSVIPTISIRGLNTNGGASMVGIYVDDTPVQGRLSQPQEVGGIYPLLFDLNRVEVARGPQGTLFGAGSEAGTVRFISNAPSLTEFSGFTHAELATTKGGDASYEAGAAAGGPITQNESGYRVSLWYRRDGGYINLVNPTVGLVDAPVVARNVNTDEKLSTRAALAFMVNDNIKVTPSIYYQSTEIDDSGRFYNIFSNPNDGYFANGPLRPEVSTDHFALPSLKVEAPLPFADLTGVASYTYRKLAMFNEQSAADGTFLPGLNGNNPLGSELPTSYSQISLVPAGQTLRAFTEEVRLASNQPDAFFTWLTGIFTDYRTQLDYQFLYSKGLQAIVPGPNAYDYREVDTDKQTAVFAQGDLHFTDKWTATLGVRVARVTVDTFIKNGTGYYNAPPPLLYDKSTETPYTPHAAVSYQLDPDNLFYISAGKGFRPGGGNTPAYSACDITVPSTFKSDYIWNYEVGAKDKLFGGRVQIDTSVFYDKWSNVQQEIQLQCFSTYEANAGSAVSKGFDLTLQALLTDQLRFNVLVGYADAYYTQNVYNNVGAPLVLSGDKVGVLPQVNAPWNVNTFANYLIPLPLPQGEKINLRGEFLYTSRNPGPFLTQNVSSPSYYPLLTPDPPTHLTNLRLNFTKDKFDLSLFVDNLFNSHPVIGRVDFAPESTLFLEHTFRPRTIGLTGNYEF